MLKYLFLFIALFPIFTLHAQQVTNMQVTQLGDNVVINYDITSNKAGQTFDIKVECSTDGGKTFTIFPTALSGDLKSVTAGFGKRIVWEVLKEREVLEGKNFVFQLVAIEKNAKKFNATNYSSISYLKYKKAKNVWLIAALVSSSTGVIYYIQSDKYYKEYQLGSTNAAILRQKIKIYDLITPISLGIAGFCSLEFVINASKQGKVKKQSLSFYPQPLQDGLGLGIVYNF